ncbi:hypothetical protein SDC9_182784 [bioreactor metagenome]|uniref:ABC transporter ATP-binding protein YtrB n=1 Tax=bioreactor metagenome TaxID=1076179 RepID=A0A645H8C4_9ZZZZ
MFLEFIQDEERAILLSSHITTDLEKIADYICFINNGKQIFFKEKDELLEKYGIFKCGLEEVSRLNKADILGMRKNKFGAEILVSDKSAALAKYPFGMIDHATIDEIMVLSSEGVKI